MAFSTEWEKIYQNNEQISIWPWSNCVSLCHRYGNLHEGMKVLELGCGAGANIPFFVQRKAAYYAVDGSATMVEKLKEKFGSLSFLKMEILKIEIVKNATVGARAEFKY